MSLARCLLGLWFKGIVGVEDKFFASFPFSRKSSGVMILCKCTSEEFTSGTSELSLPKNSKESLVPYRLDTSSKLIILGSVCWMGRSEHWRGSHKSGLFEEPSSESGSRS